MENLDLPEKELAAPVLHPHPTIPSVEQTRASITQSHSQGSSSCEQSDLSTAQKYK